MGDKLASIVDTVNECLDSLALVAKEGLGELGAALARHDDAAMRLAVDAEGAEKLTSLEVSLARATRNARAGSALGEELDSDAREMVLAWARGVAAKRDLVLAPLLESARAGGAGDAVERAARARVLHGPLVDALSCLASTGDASWLAGDSAAAARARLDLLVWEAGAAALSIPALGPWLWSDSRARQMLIFRRARGTLRERSLAARMLCIAADGMPVEGLPVSGVVMTTRVAQLLASHPEPVVWIPAARALGRLAARVPTIPLQLFRWRASTRAWQRRRAVTALASIPGPAGDWLERDIDALLASDDPWEIGSLGPAIPYLVRERGSLWEPLARRLLAYSDGPHVTWSLVGGLLAVTRAAPADAHTEELLRTARARCLAARPDTPEQALLWQTIRRDTDFLDGFDADPSFPEVLLDRTVRDAVRVGGDAVQHRAASIARSIAATFDGSLQRSASSDHPDDVGHAIASVESCARAAAVGLWQPILAAAGRDSGALDEQLRIVRAHMGEAFSRLLAHEQLTLGLRRAAVRSLGNLVDATTPDGDDPTRSRGRVAAFALGALAESRWAEGAATEELEAFRTPIRDLLWRVSDALHAGRRLTGDHTASLGELAAWWVTCLGGIELLEVLDASAAGTGQVASGVRRIREACAAARLGQDVSSWSSEVLHGLAALGAQDTMLAYAIDRLIGALDTAAASLDPSLERSYALEFLGESVALLGELRRDPVAALGDAWDESAPVVDSRLLDLARTAIETGAPSPVDAGDMWGDEVGPLFRPLVSELVARVVAVRRTRYLAIARADHFGPYRKLRRLGGGGQSEVWLVSRGGSRRYVLKVPNAPLSLNEAQRRTLARLLETEARLLESLHAAKVATFCDYGWEGTTPYLVLEYLIGADLDRYAQVRRLDVAELQPVVRDVCLGLRALHERGIVHRDLKPGNVFLRLHLPRDAEEMFDPAHRDPSLARVSEAVLIDFGIAKLLTDRRGGGPRAAEGTLGFMSPEQASLSDELDGKSDVYGLAATVFTALTGHCLFEEKQVDTAWIIAHALEVPFDNELVIAASRDLPAELITLLRDATSLDPDVRPDVDEFSDRFAALG